MGAPWKGHLSCQSSEVTSYSNLKKQCCWAVFLSVNIFSINIPLTFDLFPIALLDVISDVTRSSSGE